MHYHQVLKKKNIMTSCFLQIISDNLVFETKCVLPQNLQEPQAAEGANEEEEEEEEDDEEEEEDEITSAESDDSEEEVDVELPRIQLQSKKGQNWDKTTISY